MSKTLNQDELIGRAMTLVHDTWREASRGITPGEPIRVLPRVDFAESQRRSKVGKALLEQGGQIDLDLLPHELALTVRVALSKATNWSREEEWYWLVFDALGAEVPAMFAATPYGGGILLGSLLNNFSTLPVHSRGDRHRYLGLLADYAELIGQLHTRTVGQEERGIFMPRAQLLQSGPLLIGLKAQAMAVLKPLPERAGAGAEEFLAEVDRTLHGEVAAAYDAFIAFLAGDYAGRCGDTVGLGQYAGGPEVYEALVKTHTTMNLIPAQVHARGLERMTSIWRQMKEVLDGLGFEGDPKAFVRAAADDPQWRARTPEAIAAVFQRYIDRLKPKLEQVFHMQSPTPYHVEALPAALSGSMTFGYYDAPTPERPSGRYLFNAKNLAESDLCSIASLTYHEMAPGHHTHISRQFDAQHLHPLRKRASFTAYNEGWAEYAATLAGELGGYEAPQEHFGRLMMDAFLTSRLVVDTGMNALGWDLETARQYMRDFTFMNEVEIRSESVRYSCDIPGQSLAYKLGDTHMLEMREKMRARLGDRFDIRDFHEAVLKPGSLPLSILADHVQRETERIAGA